MEKTKQWNKEFIYQIMFLVIACVVLFGSLVYLIYGLINPNPSYESIISGKSKSINDSLYIIEWVIFYILMFFSIFKGIKSMKKIEVEGKRKIFDIVPQSLFGWLAFIIVFISSIFLILMTIGLLFV